MNYFSISSLNWFKKKYEYQLMKMNTKFLFWSLGIGTLYAIMNSRLAYLVGGVFIGVNYHEQLAPYTKPVQDEVVTRVNLVRDVYFPDVKLPEVLQRPEIRNPPRKRGYEYVVDYFKKKDE